MLQIDSLLERRPKQLSGGQRQRVALGRAIVRQPAAFLMDEPLSNLDAQLRVHTRGELKRLTSDLGVTTIYVTHDQAEAMTLADRVAIVRDGVLQQVGPPRTIYAQPANMFVGAFLGNPGMNFLEGELQALEGGLGLAITGQCLVLPDAWASTLRSRTTNGSVYLGVRPEDLDVLSEPGPGAAPASVYVTEALGNETLVRLLVGEQELVARAEPTYDAGVGQPVWVRPNMAQAHIFDGQTRTLIV
jgi:multiple sugar transport system ATP-binding protein